MRQPESVNEVLGVDIGGSHITAALVDLSVGEILPETRQRREVDSNNDAEVILNNWCEVINEAYTHRPGLLKKLGIGMPGPFDYEKGICLIKDQEKFRSLYKVNIREELALRLQMDPADVLFINDAAAFLQGEVFSGAAKGGARVIGLTLGTGLGSAFCDRGIPRDAALWQSPFKKGIAEDYLSTRWFVNRYQELTNQKVVGVKELMDVENEEVKSQLFEEFSNNLSAFLKPIIRQREADIVVIGGNIANAHLLFLPLLQARLPEDGLNAKIRIAKLKENASLIGAASCGEIDHLNIKP